jgi:probable F420-dependent oxidoreductase
VRFGVSLPTGKEGLSLPLPFCEAPALLELTRLAERLGYDSVWGNDHIHPPAYLRHDFDDPPRFYELLVTLAAAAGATERVRLGAGILVLPIRDPVVLAQQVATLDQLSGGRLVLGLGMGAYREEFEAVHPRLRGARRGTMMDEGLAALALLFRERRSTFDGEYYAFDVELHPKPAQEPLPILVGGNHPNALRRAATLATGWMPTGLDAAQVREGRERLGELAAAAGRDPESVVVSPQIMCCIAATQEEAVARFRRSRYYVHMQSLVGSTLVGALERAEEINLIGTPDEVARRIGLLAEVGVEELGAISFVSDTVEEMAEHVQLFAEDVLPAFAKAPSPA